MRRLSSCGGSSGDKSWQAAAAAMGDASSNGRRQRQWNMLAAMGEGSCDGSCLWPEAMMAVIETLLS